MICPIDVRRETEAAWTELLFESNTRSPNLMTPQAEDCGHSKELCQNAEGRGEEAS